MHEALVQLLVATMVPHLDVIVAASMQEALVQRFLDDVDGVHTDAQAIDARLQVRLPCHLAFAIRAGFRARPLDGSRVVHPCIATARLQQLALQGA